MSGIDRKYMHPGYKKLYPIRTVLRDLAGQEGCDGEPYDAMQFAADTIDDLEKALAAAEAREAELRALIEGVGVNLWDKAEMSERDEAGNQTIILWHPSGMLLATLSVSSHAPALTPAHIDLMMSDLLDVFVARERLRALAETTKGDE